LIIDHLSSHHLAAATNVDVGATCKGGRLPGQDLTVADEFAYVSSALIPGRIVGEPRVPVPA
jgi:hypothetical protein